MVVSYIHRETRRDKVSYDTKENKISSTLNPAIETVFIKA
jgi:hypothetical protein